MSTIHTAFPPTTPFAQASPARNRNHFDFAPMLGDARSQGEPQTRAGKARQAAEAFVGDALVLPILKQVRESADAAPPFNRGKHEEMFAPLMDQAIATEIVRSENFPLVDRIAQQMLKPGGAAPQAEGWTA